MKIRANPRITQLAITLDCDYLFAVGLLLALDEMNKEGLGGIPLNPHTVHELGLMPSNIANKLSTELSTKIWDIYGDTMVDIKRDKERDKKRTYRGTHKGTNAEKLKITRFTKPSYTDVEAYTDEINYNIDPQKFIDYYDGNGWMIGKNHMKDWKAALRGWKRRAEERGENTGKHREPTEQDLFAGNTPEEIELIARLAADGNHWG